MNRLLIILSILALFACKGNENKQADIANDSIKASEIKHTYTCPMHPEIISDTAGKCPRCGMDLEVRS